MKKIKLLGLLLIPFASIAQHNESVTKNFTEKLEGINTSNKELNKNGTDNSSIGQAGNMSNNISLVTVSSRTMSFPLQLNYTAGIKASQQSGPVGLGWTLPIGSIKRDYGAYYPDYSSTAHEADMYNIMDYGQSSQTNKGKFYTTWDNGSQTIQGTSMDPGVHQKYLGFDAIANDETRLKPLSDMYHISIPGKLTNSFFNNGLIEQPHDWQLTEMDNLRIEHTVKTYQISQEFSRINETNLLRDVYNDLRRASSFASAIGVLPYVKNGFAKIPTSFNDDAFSANENERYVRYEDFEKFIITDENGTKYIFGRALRGQRFVFNDDPYWSNNLGTEPLSSSHNKGSFWKIDYIAEWLLTEIRSVDYFDTNGNGIADDADAGDWIRFEYTEPEKTEASYWAGDHVKANQVVPMHREWSSFSQTDRASSLMRELAYLKKIITPTQEIDFTISERYDVNHDYFTKPANKVGSDYYYEDRKYSTTTGTITDFDIEYPVETMKYDQIEIKSRLVKANLYPNENLSIGTIKFNYAAKGSPQELAVSSYLIRNNDKLEKIASSNGKLVGSPTYSSFNIGNFTNTTDKRGKTTLLCLEFYGSTVSAAEKNEYKFEYGYNPSFDEFHKREIARAYFFPSLRQGSSTNNHVLPYSKADALTNYSESVFTSLTTTTNASRTGMSAYDFLIDFPYQEVDYKLIITPTELEEYTDHFKTTPDGHSLSKSYTTHSINPIVDVFGYVYIPGYPNASTAWSLTKITYPTGGEISFKYEPAAFVPSDGTNGNSGWSITQTNIPVITRYNEIAKQRSYIQEAHNRMFNYSVTGLAPKHLTSTFEIDLPLNYGIRLKEKTSNDRINPTVTLTYEYDNGTFTALPTEFLQNALSGFNHFITRENHKHSNEFGRYYLAPTDVPYWDYDFAEKMSEMCHTNISLDDYSSTFFYKKIRTKKSDNSYVELEYGAALNSIGIFPSYNLYSYIMKGGSAWQGSYVLAGDNLSKSPISLLSESYFEAGNTATPYKKTSYTYQRFEPLDNTRNLNFDYNGSGNGLGTLVLWNIGFNYYRPYTNNNPQPTTTYRHIHDEILNLTLTTSSFCTIGNGGTEGPSNSYTKWMFSKTYLQKETTNYKGIISENLNTYEMANTGFVTNAGPELAFVLRETKKSTLNEPYSYISRYKYAFEEYLSSTPKFKDLHLISPLFRTTTYLNNSSVPANTLSDQIVTYNYALTIPKVLDSYVYETNNIDPVTGTFTPTAFSTSDASWRVSESDIYEYNQAGMPVSKRSNQLYSKVIVGNGSTNVKATFSGTERPFDATYTGFEDFTDLKKIGKWNNQSYLNEDWYTEEVESLETTTKVVVSENGSSCAHNSSFPSGSGSGTLYYVVTTNDITNLKEQEMATFYYTVGGTTTPVSLVVESFNPTIIMDNPQALNYTVCFTSAPLPNVLMTITNSKIVMTKAKSRLSNGYARTGKYSYKLASIRTSGEATKKTPVRPVRIAPTTLATECNVPEGPGDGGVQARNPNVPASCYWDYTASLWLKYDSDIPPLTPPAVPSTPVSDDVAGDAIYRRGEVNTTNDPGVRIICKVWNSDKTIVRETFTFYPQSLNTSWKQYSIDFSVFKGPEQWLEVYVENTVNQVGVSIPNYKSAFVDDIVISPKEAKYGYSVTDARGNQTFKINNNDVYVQSAFDSKGRNSSIRNPYGKIVQEFSYFDQANWTTSNNYLTEVKWVSNGLFNTTRYFLDGFGRTKQVQNSDHVRNLRSVSETNVYNNKGQVIQSYKPYYLSQYGLDAKYDPTYATQTQTLYTSNYAFSEVTFELKPEDIVSTVSAPRANTETPIVSSQSEYMNATTLTHVNSSGTATFPAGTLIVNQTVNPLGKITRTYMNRMGQVIMEEHQIGMNHTQNPDGSIAFTSTDLGFAQTWFYYDGAGRITSTYDPENKKTSYFYNSLGAIIKTISPDKGISELRYDKYGQVRFSRSQNDITAASGNVYGTSQFKYSKYDKWGQTVESGVVTVAPDNLGVSTTSPPFPTGDFFNDYSKINDQDYPKTTDKFVQIHVQNTFDGTRKFYSSTVLTSQKTYSQHVLNTGTYLYTPGKTDIVTTSYMADGQVAKTTYTYDGLAGTHQVSAVYNDMNLPVGKDYTNSVNSAFNFKWRTTIDIYGRTITNNNTYNSVDNLASKNYYDPLGNVLLVGFGATGNSSNPHIDYISIKKNIRGELINQMSKNYRVGLTYDAAGNITNQYWSNEKFDPASTNSTKINQYAYTYDKMKRLIGADYKQSTLTSNPFAYYSTLNANIPSDFVCTLDGEVVALAFRPYFDEFESNIKNNIDVVRSRSCANALNQLQSDYMRNNVQYADMSTTQIDDFFAVFISNCRRNLITPTDFEYYQAEKANDQAHITYLKNNPVQSKSFKYMKVILGGMPWTPPVNCMPNPNATAYGYLQNFPTPIAASNDNSYDEAFWYQKNGNFTTLNRNNPAGVKTQYLYDYNYSVGSNRLGQISTQVIGVSSAVLNNYGYDGNGNITADNRNGVSSLSYSSFDDLPISITSTSGQHNYRYFGGARSVKEISATDREYYIDQVILDQNGTVKSYQTASGYAIPNGSTASYFYQVKDWLGSMHTTMNSSGVIVNAMDYYSYGKPMPFPRNALTTNHEGYRYQFTGHEKDGETNYQYHGARYYDEDLGRYMSVDPLAKEYHAWSSYNYAMSNPVRLIDPNGKGPTDFISLNGVIIYDSRVKGPLSANYHYGKDAIYRAPGYTYTSRTGKYTVLGENGHFTSEGKSFEAVNNYTDPLSATDLAWMTSSGVGSEGNSSGGEWLSTVNLDFFGEGFNTTNPNYGYFNPAWLTPEQIQAYKAIDNIQNWTAGAMAVIATLPLALEYGSVMYSSLIGEGGTATQISAWYRVGNTVADATVQVSQGKDLSTWNWGSTIGNLTLNNAFLSPAPGLAYSMAQDGYKGEFKENFQSNLNGYFLNVTGNYLTGGGKFFKWNINGIQNSTLLNTVAPGSGVTHGLGGYTVPTMWNIVTSPETFENNK